MTKEEHKDLTDAVERIISRAANDDKIPYYSALGIFGTMTGFKMFLDEYYENHKTVA